MSDNTANQLHKEQVGEQLLCRLRQNDADAFGCLRYQALGHDIRMVTELLHNLLHLIGGLSTDSGVIG
ncbi:hypothetical protein D3C81_2250860 [compost metagenome]